MIHTDTLNESGFVEDTIAAFKGRTIHAFHTEGAGGGHIPDLIGITGAGSRGASTLVEPVFEVFLSSPRIGGIENYR